MPEFTRHEIQLLADYHEMTTDVMHMIFPQLTRMELGMAIDDAIKQYLENPNVLINNSYKHVEVQTTLLELAQYIYDKQPIMTN